MALHYTNLTLGTAIRQRRLELKITQEELATRILSNQTTVSRLELDTVSPSFRLITEIAFALDLLPSELVKLAEEFSQKRNSQAE